MLTPTFRRAMALAALLTALAGGFGAPAARAAGVGDPAPDFAGKWINHADTTLADLKGRVVLIEFWRTW